MRNFRKHLSEWGYSQISRKIHKFGNNLGMKTILHNASYIYKFRLKNQETKCAILSKENNFVLDSTEILTMHGNKAITNRGYIAR